MKKWLFTVSFAIAIGCAVFAQDSLDMPDRIIDRTDLTKTPAKGETEILFYTRNSECRFYVYIEGTLVAQVEPYDNIAYKQEKVIVKDGTNVIEVAQLQAVTVGKKRLLGIFPRGSSEEDTVKWELSGRDSIKIKSKPKSNSITVELSKGRSSPKIDIVKTRAASAQSQTVNAPSVKTAQKPKLTAPPNSSSLEKALYTAGDALINSLPESTTIAIISVSSRDKDAAAFVIDELAYVLVNAGNYKIVDRKSLDTIRKEQDFQASGEIDDDSAVSIGKLLGANIVITGNISGSDSMRRLRLKALDVKTAEIVAMASEAF